MARRTEAESRPVFEHLVGTYRRIAGFDERGNAEFFFRIRDGKRRGFHWVAIEPFLLRKPVGRHRPMKTAPIPGASKAQGNLRKESS